MDGLRFALHRPAAAHLGRLAVAALLGYAWGTLPSADIVARRAGGPDLRSTGSGNPGAANAANVLGPRAGLAVLLADIGKGAVAGRLGLIVAGPVGANVAASAAVVGHCHPPGRGRSGGKGVATSVGQVLATFPVYFPIDAAVAIGTAAVPTWKRRAFGATTVSSAVWVTSSVVWWRGALPNAWGPRPTMSLPVAAAVSSAVIIGRFLSSDGPPGSGRDDAADQRALEPDPESGKFDTTHGVPPS